MVHPLLARYLAGECSEAEAEEVRRWIAESPDNRRTFEQFQMIWDAGPTEPAWDVRAALAAVEQELRERPPLALVSSTPTPSAAPVASAPAPSLTPTQAASPVRRWLMAAKVASVIAFVAGGLTLVFGRSGRTPSPDTAVHTITTARGQRASFHLPDGSSVVLAPGSTLRYPDNYGVTSREVMLEGMGYFKVQHDERRQFFVRTRTMVATDRGTEFAVAAYSGDADANVAVRSGLVELRSATVPATAGVMLEPGTMGRLGVTGEPVVTRADTVQQFAWTRGELVFSGASLHEAAAQLGRWYDVDVRLASPDIGALRLEASFEDEPVAEVFERIARALQLQVERSGRTYTFRAK